MATLPLPLDEKLPHYYRIFLSDFRKSVRNTIAFHFVFAAAFIGEFLAILFFLPALSHSTLLALAVGSLFLTTFTYFVLLFYYQASKPEQYAQMSLRLVEACRPLVSEGSSHLALAHALLELAQYLESEELSLPAPLSAIGQRVAERDLFRMKLHLIEGAIDEHLKQVPETPMDLELHMSLGSAYVLLAKLLKSDSSKESLAHEVMRLAMEEFFILSQVAPQDPWVHEQLADGFRELGQPEEELREIELIQKLKPKDFELLFRLGTLLFQKGETARGLKIYEELKAYGSPLSEPLIADYGKKRAILKKLQTES